MLSRARASLFGYLPTHDFNGDGYSDIVWHDTSGDFAFWLMNRTSVSNPHTAGVANVAVICSIVGAADFNGDGRSDILWRDTQWQCGDLADVRHTSLKPK